MVSTDWHQRCAAAVVGPLVGREAPVMLNVKVLTGANVEAYYAEAVVSGVEDYYLGTDAPAGVWCASASLLGLSGNVAQADLTAVLDDRHPRDGVRLGLAENRRVRGRSPSWKITSPAAHAHAVDT